MSDGPKWFAPQTHGYGSGLPIAWQGWAILSVFLLIVKKTTRGGWRWRSGKEIE